MFEDVDEDFDQELGQLSLGRYIYTKFVQFLDIVSPSLVLQCQIFFLHIEKDRGVLGGASQYVIFNFRLISDYNIIFRMVFSC